MNPDMVDKGFAENEIDILKQLHNQSYIVDMEAAFVHPSRPVASIFTEYCDFGSMEGLINRHGCAHESIFEGWIWKVFHQMSFGLYILHSKRILHLDLKPGNFLLKSAPGSTLDIKIADFGSACGGQNDIEGSHLRDRNFVSPDRMQNTAADVWGLGAILLCLCRLTRNPPRDRHGSVDRDTGVQYSLTLAQATLGCMRTSARDRFSSRDLPGIVAKMNSKFHHTRIGGASPIPPRDRMS
jgi:serine/threonine protein kinase